MSVFVSFDISPIIGPFRGFKNPAFEISKGVDILPLHYVEALTAIKRRSYNYFTYTLEDEGKMRDSPCDTTHDLSLL